MENATSRPEDSRNTQVSRRIAPSWWPRVFDILSAGRILQACRRQPDAGGAVREAQPAEREGPLRAVRAARRCLKRRR
eukprot:scaffold1778_cov246-Pinguiococcus_pyrenoidosus.AAC.18